MQYREIKVTSKGQITLPKFIRERLGISVGDYLQVELRSGELVIRPSPRHNERELLLAYAKEHSKEQVAIEEIHRMFSGLPFSVGERVGSLRREEP